MYTLLHFIPPSDTVSSSCWKRRFYSSDQRAISFSQFLRAFYIQELVLFIVKKYIYCSIHKTSDSLGVAFFPFLFFLQTRRPCTSEYCFRISVRRSQNFVLEKYKSHREESNCVRCSNTRSGASVEIQPCKESSQRTPYLALYQYRLLRS